MFLNPLSANVVHA